MVTKQQLQVFLLSLVLVRNLHVKCANSFQNVLEFTFKSAELELLRPALKLISFIFQELHIYETFRDI